MIQLIRVQDHLPDGFAALRAEADAEGFRAVSRLADEWAASPGMFVCLLAAPDGLGGLAGIGGVTHEPEPTDEPAMRMRRLYVSPGARRRGVGRTLVNGLLQEALDTVSLVTVNAGGTISPAFWAGLDFVRVEGRPWTHEFRPAQSRRRQGGPTRVPSGMSKTSVSIDSALVAEAETAGINIADVVEEALRAALRQQDVDTLNAARAVRWAKESDEAMADYNRRVEANRKP